MLLRHENQLSETLILLSPPMSEDIRQRRGAAVGMAAMAAVGLSDSGFEKKTQTIAHYEDSLVIAMTKREIMRN